MHVIELRSDSIYLPLGGLWIDVSLGNGNDINRLVLRLVSVAESALLLNAVQDGTISLALFPGSPMQRRKGRSLIKLII